MRKWLGLFLSIILVCGSIAPVVAETDDVEEAGQTRAAEITAMPLLDHDVTDQITVAGGMRLNPIPLVVPVKNQSFSQAVAIMAVDNTEMTPSQVMMRLDSSYCAGTIKENDIVEIRVWMRVAEGDGEAQPYLQTATNTITLELDSVALTDEWKQYRLFATAMAAMDTVKTSIRVGYPGQITYFADLELYNYGSDYTQEEVERLVLGEEYTDMMSEYTSSEMSDEMKAAVNDSVILISDCSKAYVKGKAEYIDETAAELSPYMSGSKMYLPLRFVAERCGAEVSYDESSESIEIRNGENAVIIYRNDMMWKTNGKRWRAENGLQFKNDRAFITYDTLAALLRYPSEYDADKRMCVFCTDGDTLNELKANDYYAEIYNEAVLTPIEYYSIAWKHDQLTNEIGIPALIEPTDEAPQIIYSSEFDSEIDYQIYYDNEAVGEPQKVSALSNEEMLISISDQIGQLRLGEYRIDMKIDIGDMTSYDALYFFVCDVSKRKNDDSKVIYMDDDGNLVYVPDYRGNTIPNYSGVGYKNGAENIPDVPAVIEISPSGGDDTDEIQAALDYVASLPQNVNGFRGAVQLTKGVFQMSGMLTFSADGVVLRGSGNDKQETVDAEITGPVDEYVEKHKNTTGTIIVLTTTDIDTRMMDIAGSGGAIKVADTETAVIDNYVHTGATTIRVEDSSKFAVGDEIIIEQYGNLAWIHEIGMDQIGVRTTVDANIRNNADSGTNQWGAQTWYFERKIIAVEGNKITIDLPIVNSIDKKWGGATVYKYSDAGRIQNIGVENMRVTAAWTPNENNVDETYHASSLVYIKNAKDIWIRNVTTEHLQCNDIDIASTAKRVTVEDFWDLVSPISYYSGEGYESTGRTFLETGVYCGRYGVMNAGQQILMQRFHGINLRHLIEYSSRAAGPNVAYEAESLVYFNQMGPHQYYSVGGLYDNVDGALHIENRWNMGSGHGWGGAWFTSWNCTDRLAVQAPPTAMNYAIGHVGLRHMGDYAQFPQGYWDLEGTPSNIRSLFVAQTKERYGDVGLEVLSHKANYDFTVHDVPVDLGADIIMIDGEPLKGFDRSVYSYRYISPYGSTEAPTVTADSAKYTVDVQQAADINDQAVVTVKGGDYVQKYKIAFTPSFSPYFKLTSSGDDGNVAENVCDHNLNTRWSASGAGQWLLFEMNETVEISKIGIAFYKGSERATTFSIEVSDDGENFNEIYSGTASGLTEDIEIYSFAPVMPKYVRITGYENNLNAWNSISEVRFYNQQGEELFN